VSIFLATRRCTPGPLRVAGAALFGVAMLIPHVASAHVGQLATPHDVWQHWDANPVEIVLVVLPALWYAIGVRALWHRAGLGHGVTVAQAVAFEAGMFTLAVALFTPLDAMAEALFSVHMIQHLLLILVAAPLCVFGAPLVPALMVLPQTTRVSVGRWWVRRTSARRALHVVTGPGVVFVLQMLALWFWHFPGPYEAALVHPGIHALEHLSFFVTASLFAWVVAAPCGRPRASEGMGILLVGATLMQSGVLGALLMFARVPWYPAHAEGAHLWGTTLLQDQQLAGLLMWIPASGVYIAASAWLFLRWMRRDERLAGASALSIVPRLEQGPP
jgi:putative membrane protein